jgi:type VI secretion system protein ImpL
VDTGQLGTDAADIVIGDAIEESASVRTRLLIEALRSAADTAGQPAPKPPGAVVEERFAWLQALTARVEEQPSQLDRIMGLLLQVNQDFNKVAFRGDGAAAEGGEALAALQGASSQIEGPLARWASQITTGGAGITADGTRASLNARWQQDVLPFCTQAMAGKYPFDRGAAADIAMADFAKLFGPGGLIDGFVSANLADLIDTSKKPWTWKVVNGADLGISQAVLDQLQAASEIRDAFFPNGPAPGVAFQITPMALDPNAEDITLVIDGQNVTFAQNQGQPLPTAITWPGAVGVAQVTFNPPLEGGESVVTRDGPWGWFRLLDAAEVRAGNAPDRRKLIFNVGGRIALFQLQVSAVQNAFQLPALSSFACPQSF